MNNKTTALINLVFLITVSPAWATTFAFNTIKPYDRYLWQRPKKTGEMQIGTYFTHTFKERAVWCDNTKICNILQLYACNQNALAMVRGFDPSSEIGQFAAQLANVPDNGIRGHLIPSGSFHMSETALSAQYWLPHSFCIGLYMPIIHMTLNNVCWRDLTEDITPEDWLTKQLLTDDLSRTVCNLGGPSLGGWHATGIGDISLIGKFQRDFPQSKPILTNVQIAAHLGISLPTGKRANEDLLFSLPLGYDGAPGILFGGALELTWKNHFVGGVELYLTQLIGNSRLRRIKTYCDQTDFLLLAKTNAHIDWGFIQRYRLYLGARDIMRGLSLDLAYQFQKQGDSLYSLMGNSYITSITNSAEQLKFWTLHYFMLDLTYNFGYDQYSDRLLSPALTLLYQHAFKGRRALLLDKWGFALSLNF